VSRFRAVIAEDEPLARRMLRDLLGRDAEIEVAGEAGDGRSALELIRRLRPDIALLDIEMPEMGGVDVAAALPPGERPVVVFVTAFGRFAPEAFDVEALDYVVKPFSDARFHQALARAKGRVRERRLSSLAERMAHEASPLSMPEESAAASSGHLSVIPIRRAGRTLRIPTSDVLWIESQDYCVRLHLAAGSHLLRASLALLAERLPADRFVRVHRRAIVNVGAVVALEHVAKGHDVVVLSNGARCRISQSYQVEVDRMLRPRLR
jgi:two-component system LytT family response regulator